MSANQIRLLAEEVADILLGSEEKNSLSSGQADIIAIELDKLFLKYMSVVVAA
jgi:hypothetical protein